MSEEKVKKLKKDQVFYSEEFDVLFILTGVNSNYYMYNDVFYDCTHGRLVYLGEL